MPQTANKTKATTARPFLKWAGGKTKLLPELMARMPERIEGTYYEPFIGGGALFFHLQPKQAVISDINPELINAYWEVKYNPGGLIKELMGHENTPDYYYELRKADRLPGYAGWGSTQKASRFIYLNKTCFNGLHRVNQKGQFNTPYGKYKSPNICDQINLTDCHKVLKRTHISIWSFENALRSANKDDFVYLDPPYVPVNKSSDFTSYGKDGFTFEQQVQLRDLCVELDDKGVKFMASNSSVPFVHSLYEKFKIEKVDAPRSINSNGKKRGNVKEVIITNY